MNGFRSSRMRRCMVVALVLLAALLLLAWLLGRQLARAIVFPGCARPLVAAAAGPEAEVVEYAAEGGPGLRGALVRARAPVAPGGPGTAAGESPALVYFHGNAECAADNLELADVLAGLGLHVFVAEYRGYGGCAGSPSEDGLLADGRAAVAEAARRLGVPEGEVILVGRSLGSGVAAALAAEGLGRGVVLVSPYTSIVDVGARLVPRPLAEVVIPDRFDSRARLLACDRPVLVVHGTADRVIPYEMGETLARELGPRARLVTLRGTDHDDVFLREGGRVRQELVRFAAEAGR